LSLQLQKPLSLLKTEHSSPSFKCDWHTPGIIHMKTVDSNISFCENIFFYATYPENIFLKKIFGTYKATKSFLHLIFLFHRIFLRALKLLNYKIIYTWRVGLKTILKSFFLTPKTNKNSGYTGVSRRSGGLLVCW